MAAFSEDNFVKKLTDLNNSQQSILTLSLWLIHHRKQSKTVVDIWLKELKKAKTSKKLTFLYLSNDVIQNSRKKGPEYGHDFKSVLPDAFEHTAPLVDEKTRGSMERLINIWKDRNLFEKSFISEMMKAFGQKGVKKVKGSSSGYAQGKDPSKAASKSRSKAKSEAIDKADKDPFAAGNIVQQMKKVLTPRGQNKEQKREAQKSGKDAKEQPPAKKKKKQETSLIEEVEKELENGTDIDIPEPEILVKVLEELENSASSDAAVRERIAALPPEVSDVSLLEKLEDKKAANELAESVEEASELLAEYNSRLSAELEERKRVAIMLRQFITMQKDQLTQAEKKLKDHKAKLSKVAAVRKELKSHIQSLPDLTLLPDMSGLAPLPSAGDLFAIHQ